MERSSRGTERPSIGSNASDHWPPRAILGFSFRPEARFETMLPPDGSTHHRRGDFGRSGTWHLDLSGGDLAESADLLVAVVGCLRTLGGEPLKAASLLERRWLSASGAETERFLGDAWIVVFSKLEPRFYVYSTLMASPPFYYTQLADGILCATDFTPLLAARGSRDIDEEALPAHFLFRVVPGNRTFFRGVQRLFPGQLLTWDGDRLDLRTLRDFRSIASRYRLASPQAVAELDERLVTTLRDLRRGWLRDGREGMNLLSGGEDSCLTQLWLDEVQERGAHKNQTGASCSFAVQARSFAFEVDYALDASQQLNTRHQIYEITPQEYPELLERAIDHLQQPALYNEGVPGFLALAEALKERGGEGRVYIAGQAADALHGAYDLPQVIAYQRWRRRPLASIWMRLRAALADRRGEVVRGEDLRDVARMLKGKGRLDRPECYIALAGEVDRCLRCFGGAAVQRAFDERIELEERYFASTSLLDRVQGIDFLTAGYDPGIAAVRLFASQGLRLHQFYLDESVIRNVMMFEAGCRYQAHGRLKPLQKELLNQRGKKALTNKNKGGTNFSPDLWDWMKEGVLKDRVEAIDQHDFLPRDLMQELKREPGDFLWNLLIYDLFTKRIVRRISTHP